VTTTAGFAPAADLGRGMRFSVDPWDPSYGSSAEDDGFQQSSAKVDAAVEMTLTDWRPMAPPAARGRVLAQPEAVQFVDGVMRAEARGWIHDPVPAGAEATSAAPAVCASYASGVVCCCGMGAHVLSAQVRRVLVTPARHAEDVRTTAGTYQVRHAEADSPEDLNRAVQKAMIDLELLASAEARHGAGHPPLPGGVAPAGLLVVDGPLRGRTHMPNTLGFVKSHHSRYLEPPQHDVIGKLGIGERTPVFSIGPHWDRYSWYVRLPSRPGAPWAGVARVECGSGVPVAEVVDLADLSQTVLPRFASSEYKDSRAPQNLYPIAGLERVLRRRLGDRQLLYRALRHAAAV
jgi:hypothetical protein